MDLCCVMVDLDETWMIMFVLAQSRGSKERRRRSGRKLHFVAVFSRQYFYLINGVNLRWTKGSNRINLNR